MHVKWIPILAVLLGAQVALAVAMDLRSDRLAPAKPDTPLVEADLGPVDRISIDGPVAPEPAAADATATEGLELVKREGRWIMPEHHGAPADADKVENLLMRLRTLKRGFAIATTAGAAERFAVAENHYERRLVVSEGEQELATIFLGDSPGPRRSDARSAGDPAVYAIDLASYDLPTGADAWLDAGLLGDDLGDPVEIEVTAAGKPTVVLKRDGSSWQAASVASDRRLDAAQAAALAKAIADLKVDTVLGETAKAEWRQNEPELVLAMKDEQGKHVTWTLSKPAKDDKLVLKSSAHPWFLQLAAPHARPLLDAAAPDKLLVSGSTPTGDATKAGEAAAAGTAAMPENSDSK